MTLIYARSLNDVIGDGNNLPAWTILGDLPRFKELTKGALLLMGRKTWDSLPRKLPGRKHMVITRNVGRVEPKGGELPEWIVSSPFAACEALQGVTDKVFIIGGAQVYNVLQHYCTMIEETVVMDNNVAGDVRWRHTARTDIVAESATTALVHGISRNAFFRTHQVRTVWKDI